MLSLGSSRAGGYDLVVLLDDGDLDVAGLRDEDGGWDLNKLLIVGGAVLGVIAFAVTLNSVANRRVLTTAQRRALEK